MRDFRRLGGSWKKNRTTSKNGKQRLHFYRDHLKYESKDEAELEGVLSKYLPQSEDANPASQPTGEKPTA